jgi:hypothetical protein
MRYVVGITMDKRGREAVSLALTLAQSTLSSHPVELDLVHVIRGAPPEQAASKPEREYQKLCLEEAEQWMAKTHDLIPKAIRSTTSIHFADSMAARADRHRHCTPLRPHRRRGGQPRPAAPLHRRIGGQRAPPRLPRAGRFGPLGLPAAQSPDPAHLRPRACAPAPRWPSTSPSSPRSATTSRCG